MNPPNPPTTPTKHNYRNKVWEHMMKNELLNFPLNCHHRIPNFTSADLAAKRLSKLDEFKNARVIKVNPDKPQEPVRLMALQAGKEILVPIPRLKSGLFLHVSPSAENGALKDKLKVLATRHGIQKYGKPVGIDSDIKIDLVVMGSVCVSKGGYRIGKGEGFADLEFAMIMRMGAVSDKTVIVTTVHDCQVFDYIEDDLYEKHDVPVDIIVTPERTIYVENRLNKPAGIFWDLLTPKRLKSIQILQQFKKMDEREGKQVILKEEDPCDNEKTDKNSQRNSAHRMKKKRNAKSSSEKNNKTDADNNETEDKMLQKKSLQTYSTKKRNPKKSMKKAERVAENKDENASVDKTKEKEKAVMNEKSKNTYRPPTKFKSRSQIDFSLKLSNVGPHVRVRDLKNVLSQRGIRPTYITWCGKRGFCYLHFNKLRNKNLHQNEPIQVDSIVANLQQLYVGDPQNLSDENLIIVKPANPITRIEITDVTSV